MIEKIKLLIKKYRELITYIIAGGLTTLVNWATYTVFVSVFKAGITFSNAIAWIIAVIFAYVVNKLWVFESKSFELKIVLKEFSSFVGSRIATGVIEIFGVPLLVKIGLDQKIMGIEGALSKIAVSIIVIILNYVFSKIFVFRKKKDE